MRKSLYTALVVAAGVASLAGAAAPSAIHITDANNASGAFVPTTKLGLLNISLLNQFQAYDKPTGSGYWGVQIKPGRAATPYRFWDNQSYDYLGQCLGTVTYRSNSKQVNNQTIICLLYTSDAADE